MSTLKLFLFGPPRVELAGAPIDLQRRKALALLIYLAISGRPHSRDALAALFWPDHTQSQARAYLRRDLAVLNTSLAGEWLVIDREMVELKRGPGLWVDVLEFGRLLAACRSHNHPPTTVCSDCLTLLTEALNLYPDGFLAGFTLRDSAEFDDWQFFQTESLRQELAVALERLVRGLGAQNEDEAAIPHARRWVALDPLHEPAQRALMQAYDHAGQPAAALRQYEEYVKLLEEELGLPPAEETTTLYEAIKAKRILAPFIKAEEKKSSPEVNPSTSLPPPALTVSSQSPSPQSTSVGDKKLEQQIRFCTASDGVRIAYATVGQGPVFVKTANWLSHLEFDWNSPVWRHWLAALAEHHMLIRYDQRGCGLSDWDAQELSVDTFVQDLEAVVDTLALDRFPLLGISQGGPVAITYAVRHPEKVSHLILYGTYARGRFNRSYALEEIEKGEIFLKLVKLGWGQDNPAFQQLFTTSFIPEATLEQMHWFNDLQRVSTSPENAIRLRTAFFHINVSDLATEVSVPTLILHARHDGIVPYEEGRQLAAMIPGARLVSLESKNHILLENEPAWPNFLAEVYQFVQTEFP